MGGQPAGRVPSVSSTDSLAHWCRLKFTAAFLSVPFIIRSPKAQANKMKSATEL